MDWRKWKFSDIWRIEVRSYGQIAESVLNAGGKVTGVEPQFFIDSELQYDEITELIVTKDMAERKAKMIELGDAFIAFPGGTGTLEEIAEVMSMVSLKHLNAPCILYNLNGYYDSLKQLLDHMIKMGLSSEIASREFILLMIWKILKHFWLQQLSKIQIVNNCQTPPEGYLPIHILHSSYYFFHGFKSPWEACSFP